MVVFNFDSDGQPGCDDHDGTDGLHGFNGTFAGQDGLDGHDGGDATGHARDGQDGGEVKIELSTLVDRSGDTLVQIRGSSTNSQSVDTTIPEGEVFSIKCSSRGGAGGNGGRGGRGGNGGDGAKGYDATREEAGGFGGDGGCGGDAGCGSDGANGGSGGIVNINVAAEDMYLLMAVTGANNPTELVSGGRGGRAGSNGACGAGGKAGSGGSGCEWIETIEDCKRCTCSKSNMSTSVPMQVNYYKAKASQPAGSGGQCGNAGRDETDLLHPGEAGHDGRFSFNVTNNSSLNPVGGNAAYSSLFNLKMASKFKVLEMDGRNGSAWMKDGIFEFGEVCSIHNVQLTNDGGMPTPPCQRQRIALNSSRWINPVAGHDEIFNNASVLAGCKANVPGQMKFQLGMTVCDSAWDTEPCVVEDTISAECYQLGRTTSEFNANTKFQKRFDGFCTDHTTNKIRIEFPAQNQQGFVGLSSLLPGEVTKLTFPVTNKSNKPLGIGSSRGVGVLITMATDKSMTPEDVEVFLKPAGFDATSLDPIDPIALVKESPEMTESFGIQQQFNGTFVTVPFIPANSSSALSFDVRLNKDARPCITGELRAELYLEDLYEKKWRLVQRRAHEIRRETVFKAFDGMDAVLVTTSATTQTECMSWLHILADVLNLQTAVYSLSRYGKFGPFESADPEGAKDELLSKFLPGTLVVVLDAEFQLRKGTECRGFNQALDGSTTRTYMPGRKASTSTESDFSNDFADGPSYLMVASDVSAQSGPVIKAIRKRWPAMHPDRTRSTFTHADVADFAKRVSADRLMQFRSKTHASGLAQWLNAGEDPVSSYVGIRVKHNTLGRSSPNAEKRTRWMKEAASEVSRILRRCMPYHQYTVVMKPLPCEMIAKDFCTSTWLIGELRVYSMRNPTTLPNRYAQMRVYQMLPTASVPRAPIWWKNNSMVYGVVAALSPAKQFRCLAMLGDEVVVDAMLKNVLLEFKTLIEVGGRRPDLSTIGLWMPTLGLIFEMGVAACKIDEREYKTSTQSSYNRWLPLWNMLSNSSGLPEETVQRRRASCVKFVSAIVAMTEGIGIPQQCFSSFKRTARSLCSTVTDVICKVLATDVDNSLVARYVEELKTLSTASCCLCSPAHWSLMEKRFSPEGFRLFDQRGVQEAGADLGSLVEMCGDGANTEENNIVHWTEFCSSTEAAANAERAAENNKQLVLSSKSQLQISKEQQP